MYKFGSKYIIIMNSNIKHLTHSRQISNTYQNISLTITEIHYDSKCLGIYTLLN